MITSEAIEVYVDVYCIVSQGRPSTGQTSVKFEPEQFHWGSLAIKIFINIWKAAGMIAKFTRIYNRF